jgi:transposase-like protein
MPGRTYSREFKLLIVRQLSNGEKRPAQVCREHAPFGQYGVTRASRIRRARRSRVRF